MPISPEVRLGELVATETAFKRDFTIAEPPTIGKIIAERVVSDSPDDELLYRHVWELRQPVYAEYRGEETTSEAKALKALSDTEQCEALILAGLRTLSSLPSSGYDLYANYSSIGSAGAPSRRRRFKNK